MQGKKPQLYELFVSYSERDEVQVQHLASDLRKRNIVVTTLPFDLKGAYNIAEAIKLDTKRVKILAVALSDAALATDWARRGIMSQVIQPFKKILNNIYLLRLGDIPKSDIEFLPYSDDSRIIDLSGADYETGINQIVELLSSSTQRIAPLPTPKSYKLSGIFQPSRPATELFTELKKQIQEGKTIDQRYLYWDVRAALRWQRIVELSGYLTGQVSMNLLVENAGDIIRSIVTHAKCDKFSLINLGVGTGVKDYQLISHLLKQTKELNYFAVDESFPMIQLTMKTLEELLSAYSTTLHAHYIVDDFRNLGTHKTYIKEEETQGSCRIIAFLGGSIGNFNERKILSTIREIMSEEDYMVLGTEYIGERDDNLLKRNYQDQRMKEFLFGPIKDVTGKEPDWDTAFRYDVVHSEKKYSDVGNSKTIVGFVNFNRVGEIELFSSTKYEKSDLESFLKETMDFDIIDVFPSPETPPRYGKYILKKKTIKKNTSMKV